MSPAVLLLEIPKHAENKKCQIIWHCESSPINLDFHKCCNLFQLMIASSQQMWQYYPMHKQPTAVSLPVKPTSNNTEKTIHNAASYFYINPISPDHIAQVVHNGENRFTFTSLSFTAFGPCAQLPLPWKKGTQRKNLSLSLSLFDIFSESCCCSLNLQLHVVYMGDQPQEDASVASKHHSMLHRVLGRLLWLHLNISIFKCILHNKLKTNYACAEE